ncbi:chemotaxis protein [Roseibium aquae]|uniref:Chemotaxis protein n=1 Tax=Roseibium aquae TaxID=1323746 RepID=A0A916TNK1_9HYPH|nr:chemotaxis protein [Roseibium aquae]GGB60062.1 chemotaxis protein [Roseibium aquae]
MIPSLVWLGRPLERLSLLLVMLIWLAGAVIGQVAAQQMPEHQPFEMIRTLQTLQSQVAEGNSQAHSAQRALLIQMDGAFMDARPEVWQEPRNARAAVIHLLSGGHPDVMRQLLRYDPAPAVDPRLMLAALAYVEGRGSDLNDLLVDVDPMELPPSLGGHIALVKATGLIQSEPREALTYLGQARLLMPGSLIEEAALRREIFVAGTVGEVERFQSLSLRYLRRYRNSMFASDFRRRFAIAIDALGFAENLERFSLLEGLLAEFDQDTRRALYLRLARTAVLGGHLDISREATERADPITVEGSLAEMTLRLYQAASIIDPERMTERRDILWSIDPRRLNREDRELADAVMELTNRIRHFPDPPANVIGEFSVPETLPAPEDPSWELTSMRRAQDLLDRTAELLKRVEG